jgi:hypothetical protein
MMPVPGVDKVQNVRQQPKDVQLPNRPNVYVQDFIKAKIENI